MGQTASMQRKRPLPRPWVAVAAGVWFVAVAVLLIGMFDLPRQQRAASRLVAHTLEVLDAASALEALLERTVIDGRSFIFSADIAMGTRAEAEASLLPDSIAALRALISDDAAQARALDNLAAMIDERIAMLRQNMSLKAAGDDTALLDRVRTHAARRLSDRIAETLDAVRGEERRLLVQRQRDADAAAWRAIAALIACGAVAGFSGLCALAMLLSRRRERTHLLELEASVKERTAELADSRERQQAYFNHSPIGMVVMRVRGDGDFLLEDLNPAARAAFGFGPDSERGSTHAELWPEMVARDKQRKMYDCATQRKIIDYTVEREIRGEMRLLDVTLAPLLDDASEARFVLICVHDVTTQRQLERQVVEQAERQAEAAEREMALFNNCPDELFVVRVEHAPDGPAFVYEAFSPALTTATGLRPNDLVGYRPEDCLPPAIAQTILANYRHCVNERSTVKFAETRDLPVGRRDVEGWVAPVVQPATGKIVRLVGDVRDVTERNRMEAAFRQGQKMEAIGRLAAGVAHDFNNILQAVISGLDMVMEETRPGTPAREIAGVALGAATRGSQLTHHLLSYARKQMLWPQTIDLTAFLPDIERLLSRTLGPHIAIDLRVQPGTHASADPGELETALLNIAFNAAHAMPRGGTLSIHARTDGTDGQMWGVITVADTGGGMDTATLAQAVEPFFTTKGLKGTGLGLPMVQGFAEQSGGNFRIASAPGRGTTVELRLPASAAGPLAMPEEPAAAAAPMAGRILLVDDSRDVLVTVGATLEKAGFAVIRADGGDRALALLAQGGPVDVLVTDYAMPGLNGAELIAQARLLQPGLRALIITGYAAVEYEETDGTTILHKPFHRRALIEALLRVLARDPSVAEAMAAVGPGQAASGGG